MNETPVPIGISQSKFYGTLTKHGKRVPRPPNRELTAEEQAEFLEYLREWTRARDAKLAEEGKSAQVEPMEVD